MSCRMIQANVTYSGSAYIDFRVGTDKAYIYRGADGAIDLYEVRTPKGNKIRSEVRFAAIAKEIESYFEEMAVLGLSEMEPGFHRWEAR